MPKLPTQHFGLLEYEETAEVEFRAGIPGFEHETRFVIVEPRSQAPLAYLQSMANPALCFLTLPVLSVDPRYRLRLSADDLRALGFEESSQPVINQDVVCLGLITIPEEGPLTVNLMAPIVISRRTRQAVQAIQTDSAYSFRHPLPTPQMTEA